MNYPKLSRPEITFHACPVRRYCVSIQIAFHRPKNPSAAFCIHLRGEDRDSPFCPFPLSLCPVSLKLCSFFAVLEKAFSMEQAKEAGGGERGCFGLVSSLSRPGEKVRVWHPESGSLSSLGNALTGKERQQHTRSGQTLRRKKQLAPEGRPEWSPAARGCHLLEEGLQARISRPGLRCLLPRGRRPPSRQRGVQPWSHLGRPCP